MWHSVSGFCSTRRWGLLFLPLLLNACALVPEKPLLLHSSDAVPASGESRSGETMDTALSHEVFTLTSWNICKGCRKGWKRDLRLLASRSDLLLLQEAYMRPELQTLLREANITWSMVHAFSLDGVPTGVLTGARVVPVRVRAQRVIEPYLRLPKTAVISYYNIRGQAQPLLVVNVHGVNFAPGSTELVRQFQAIRKIIIRHQGPVIVAGDFNTWSRKRLAALNRLAEASDLRAVKFEGEPSLHFGRRLDHVYYRGLIPLRANAMAMDSSDHHPLMVTFAPDHDR